MPMARKLTVETQWENRRVAPAEDILPETFAYGIPIAVSFPASTLADLRESQSADSGPVADMWEHAQWEN